MSNCNNNNNNNKIKTDREKERIPERNSPLFVAREGREASWVGNQNLVIDL